jgi:hypothetical protein
VVGQPDASPVRRAHIAPARRERRRRLDRIEAAREQVIDRARARRPGKSEALAHPLERLRRLPRHQVEVAAEHQRVGAGPRGCRLRRALHLGGSRRRAVRAGVQVPHAEAPAPVELEPGEEHPPPLGIERQRQAPDLPDARRRADQQLVRAALVGGDQVGVEVGDPAPRPRPQVARGERDRTVCSGPLGEPRKPPGRRLLEQRDAPRRSLQPAGELVE